VFSGGRLLSAPPFRLPESRLLADLGSRDAVCFGVGGLGSRRVGESAEEDEAGASANVWQGLGGAGLLIPTSRISLRFSLDDIYKSFGSSNNKKISKSLS